MSSLITYYITLVPNLTPQKEKYMALRRRSNLSSSDSKNPKDSLQRVHMDRFYYTPTSEVYGILYVKRMVE